MVHNSELAAVIKLSLHIGWWFGTNPCSNEEKVPDEPEPKCHILRLGYEKYLTVIKLF